jgi:CHAD domain-containing protein
MPRFEKWLTTATAQTPADQVARAALTERLLAVSHYLDHALGGQDEAESVHQLRVWTRRATAALKLFEPALPKLRRKQIKKVLRKFRRAAGKLRDCDIQLERLSRADGPAVKRMTKTLKRERAVARQKLKKVRRRWQQGGRLEKLIEQVLEKIAWPKRHSTREAPPFGDYCRQRLKPLAAEFFRLSSKDLKDDKSLHELRIAGKRLRYGLELAPAAMPADAHCGLYEQLTEIQDRMGEVCDELAAIDHVQRSLDGTKKNKHRRRLKELTEQQQKRLARQRASILRWWPGALRRFEKKWNGAATRRGAITR